MPDISIVDALKRVVDELKKAGFGVLTGIDVQMTLKKKLVLLDIKSI